MITFAQQPDDAVGTDAMIRAGGTDLQERLRTRNERPTIVDLTDIEGFETITVNDQESTIGAGARIDEVATRLADTYPALAQTAAGLATPQIRAVGTIGGNLLQRTRCWYFRHPHLSCFKNGGDSCPARDGRHLYGVAFDTSDCVHPHPSSLAMALLTYDATVTIIGGEDRSVAELLGDGADPSRDNLLDDGAVVTSIRLPAPLPDEQAAYFRSISRFEAEWPLVEAVSRIQRDAEGLVTSCAIGLGGVAPVPMRMTDAENLIAGTTLDAAAIDAAAAVCTSNARPLPETGYKVDLIEATVRETLERLAANTSAQR